MQKIVMDTNVFFSALYSSSGSSYQILLGLLGTNTKKYISCVCVATILELEDILFRPKNRELLTVFSDDELTAFIDDIVLISDKTRLNYLWRPFLKDSGDDKILEVAFSANASCIVTHNTKDFDGVESFFGIKILTPKQFLQIEQKESK